LSEHHHVYRKYYPPRNSHFHFVIRHSIAGISLIWRLAVNNRWFNQFVIARWRTIFFKYNLENNELFYYPFVRLNDTLSIFFRLIFVLYFPQGLAVIFSHRQVYVKREERTLFLLPKVKVEFRHLTVKSKSKSCI
jgi:hypothetical protein